MADAMVAKTREALLAFILIEDVDVDG
jgi:hypothetical protein